VPNLHRIELSEGGVRAPTEFEIADLLCSVRQMGASVSRIYVLSHGSDSSFHVMNAQLTESWMLVLDRILYLAHEFGVRLIIPFVNTHYIQSWGSTGFYAEWAGQPKSRAADFFYDLDQRAIFKQVISALLTRTNTLTGRRYADEPAVLAWELGNELADVRYGYNSTVPPPAEWSEDIAAHVRSLDPNHLIVDGGQFDGLGDTSLPLAGVDIVGRTYYNLPAAELASDLELVAGWNLGRPALQKATTPAALLAAPPDCTSWPHLLAHPPLPARGRRSS